MAIRLGFVDAPPSPDPDAPSNRPLLLEADKDAKRGPIDHHWQPEQFGKRKASWSSSALLAAGTALLIAS
jgi:hypothetical protein